MFNVSIFNIKTAESIFDETASTAVLPGEEGELSILDFHQSIVSSLRDGIVKIDKSSIPIKNGIALMQGDNLLLLVEK